MTTAAPIEDQLRRWADELGDRVDAVLGFTSCDDEGFLHEVTVQLDAPLGDRVVRAVGGDVVRVERR